jgi:hypothetical protein
VLSEREKREVRTLVVRLDTTAATAAGEHLACVTCSNLPPMSPALAGLNDNGTPSTQMNKKLTRLRPPRRKKRVHDAVNPPRYVLPGLGIFEVSWLRILVHKKLMRREYDIEGENNTIRAQEWEEQSTDVSY